MTTNNIFRSIVAALVCGILAVSCTAKFEDFNTNKHEATEEQMEQDNLKTGAFFRQLQRSVVFFADGTNLSSDYQIIQNLTADTYSGYMAPTIASNNGTHTGSYFMTESWCKAMFFYTYRDLMPAWKQMRDAADAAGLTELSALATVIKVAGMHRVTDNYGPIPYVNFGGAVTDGSYDSQEEVYKKFFEELDASIDVLTDYAVTGAKILEKYDYIYSGNATQWVKFANSLRLRLAMRVVYADAALAKKEAEAAINHPMGLMTSADDMASLKHSADLSYNHPLYDINVNFNDADIQMGASIDSYLNGYNDPRLPKYFTPAGGDGKYHGVRQGIHASNWSPYKHPAGKISGLNIDFSNTEIVWMTASEVYFLLAEAAIRGWNVPGTAQSNYELGVRTSFEEVGVAGADAYLANNTAKPADYVDNTGNNNGIAARGTITIAWEEDASFETKLERIITQKWIAIYPNGPEAWSEFRRTGYPKLFPVVNNDSQGAVNTELQIRRIPFSVDEYSTNAAGVATGVAKLGGADNAGTRLWWDKKN